MFSGIIESVMPILSSEELPNAYRVKIKKPSEFDDIKLGDSIACDGVCLTVEAFDAEQMTFALAAETIKVLEWTPASWLGKRINLERSLRFGDRIHGHLVTGHVDSLGTVSRAELLGESFFLDVKIQKSMGTFVWKKGSITLNGVSLTVNQVQELESGEFVVSVCLIPETLKRTNLGDMKIGSRLNVEPDYMARAIQRSLEVKKD